jgi:hypothetical protein
MSFIDKNPLLAQNLHKFFNVANIIMSINSLRPAIRQSKGTHSSKLSNIKLLMLLAILTISDLNFLLVFIRLYILFPSGKYLSN